MARDNHPNFDYMPRTWQVYRFHDRVAVHLGDGASAYMTADEATELSNALHLYAHSVRSVRFSASTLGTRTGTVSGRGNPND